MKITHVTVTMSKDEKDLLNELVREKKEEVREVLKQTPPDDVSYTTDRLKQKLSLLEHAYII